MVFAAQAILTDLFSFLPWHSRESLGQGSEHRNFLSMVFHVETARSLFARQERVWRPSNKFTLAGGSEIKANFIQDQKMVTLVTPACHQQEDVGFDHQKCTPKPKKKEGHGPPLLRLRASAPTVV